MEVLFFVVGSVLLVAIAFQCGRYIEDEHRRQMEDYAKICVQSYQKYLQGMYYTSTSQQRWYTTAPEPVFPTAPTLFRPGRPKVSQVDPAQFAQTLQENGQATIWIQRKEDARV